MKKILFFLPLLASTMLAAMTLTGCSQEDNPVTDYDDSNLDYKPEYKTSEDPLGDFTANFFTTDEEGNTKHILGTALDEADPSVISLKVESLSDAEMYFKGFITDEAHVTTAADGSITYTPTTIEGKQQGVIHFTPGDDGCIARITFSEDIPQALLSEVRFIDRKLWPNNASGEKAFNRGTTYILLRATRKGQKFYDESRFFFLDEESAKMLFPGSEHGLKFLCIKDAEPGEMAYLWRFQYMFDGNEQYRPVSYEHDTSYKDVYSNKHYGAFWTKAEGKGENKYQCWNSKTKQCPNYPMAPNANELNWIFAQLKAMGGYEKYFVKDQGQIWDPKYDLHPFWANETQSARQFPLYGYCYWEGKGEFYRAWTQMGYISQLVKVVINKETWLHFDWDFHRIVRDKNNYQRTDETEIEYLEAEMDWRDTKWCLSGHYDTIELINMDHDYPLYGE